MPLGRCPKLLWNQGITRHSSSPFWAGCANSRRSIRTLGDLRHMNILLTIETDLANTLVAIIDDKLSEIIDKSCEIEDADQYGEK